MKNFLLVAAAALSIVGMAMPVSSYAADPAGAASAAPAQQITVNGAVIDENGDPIAGASVLERGTTNGVNTDASGRFVLKVNAGATLEISFVGYSTQNVKAAPTVQVTLAEDAELLDDVVVDGLDHLAPFGCHHFDPCRQPARSPAGQVVGSCRLQQPASRRGAYAAYPRYGFNQFGQ